MSSSTVSSACLDGQGSESSAGSHAAAPAQKFSLVFFLNKVLSRVSIPQGYMLNV